MVLALQQALLGPLALALVMVAGAVVPVELLLAAMVEREQ
jgi:hypothetical protein